jgi:hypothetical protein
MTKHMPTRKISQETGADEVTEQEGFDMLYQIICLGNAVYGNR